MISQYQHLEPVSNSRVKHVQSIFAHFMIVLRQNNTFYQSPYNQTSKSGISTEDELRPLAERGAQPI